LGNGICFVCCAAGHRAFSAAGIAAGEAEADAQSWQRTVDADDIGIGPVAAGDIWIGPSCWVRGPPFDGLLRL
jgi:hypothetical protein